MISVKNLTKYYGDHLAVDHVSFEITEGTVLIDGYDIFEEPDEAKRRIGYLPEHPPLYMNESTLEYLRFVGEAKGLHGAELTSQVIICAGIKLGNLVTIQLGHHHIFYIS